VRVSVCSRRNFCSGEQDTRDTRCMRATRCRRTHRAGGRNNGFDGRGFSSLNGPRRGRRGIWRGREGAQCRPGTSSTTTAAEAVRTSTGGCRAAAGRPQVATATATTIRQHHTSSGASGNFIPTFVVSGAQRVSRARGGHDGARRHDQRQQRRRAGCAQRRRLPNETRARRSTAVSSAGACTTISARAALELSLCSVCDRQFHRCASEALLRNVSDSSCCLSHQFDHRGSVGVLPSLVAVWLSRRVSGRVGDDAVLWRGRMLQG
jgi:hypothetical protein